MIVYPFVFIGLIIIVGMTLRLSRKRGVCLNREAIRRNMRWIERDHIGDSVLPVSKGLTCCAIHDVEIKGSEARLLDMCHCTLHVFWVMRAAKRLQHMING